jgi:hypothetical protein
MDRLFPTKELYLADLARRRVELAPILEGVDWTGATRPPRDPAERAFFERLGIPSRFIETTEPAPPSKVPRDEQR